MSFLFFAELVLAKDRVDFNFEYSSKTDEFTVFIPNRYNGFNTYGYNLRNRQKWFRQMDARGIRGIDPLGNYWIYDPGTGNYINSNGQQCSGLGMYRRCN